MWKPFSGLAWPSSCEVCGTWPTAPVCPDCHDRHARLRNRCPDCGLRLAPGLERCTVCTSTPAPAHETVHARVDYDHPWSAWVQRLKFRQSPGTARLMADLMVEDPEANALMSGADLMAPVPLSLPGLLERGYNQSWELVRHLRRKHPAPPPAMPDLLTRPEGGPALHTLPRAQRLQASQTLFEVHPKHQAHLQGATVLLVDDVLTTGATAQAASLALREAGARAVHVWVFAHTPPPGDERPAVE